MKKVKLKFLFTSLPLITIICFSLASCSENESSSKDPVISTKEIEVEVGMSLTELEKKLEDRNFYSFAPYAYFKNGPKATFVEYDEGVVTDVFHTKLTRPTAEDLSLPGGGPYTLDYLLKRTGLPILSSSPGGIMLDVPYRGVNSFERVSIEYSRSLTFLDNEGKLWSAGVTRHSVNGGTELHTGGATQHEKWPYSAYLEGNPFYIFDGPKRQFGEERGLVEYKYDPIYTFDIEMGDEANIIENGTSDRNLFTFAPFAFYKHDADHGAVAIYDDLCGKIHDYRYLPFSLKGTENDLKNFDNKDDVFDVLSKMGMPTHGPMNTVYYLDRQVPMTDPFDLVFKTQDDRLYAVHFTYEENERHRFNSYQEISVNDLTSYIEYLY